MLNKCLNDEVKRDETRRRDVYVGRRDRAGLAGTAGVSDNDARESWVKERLVGDATRCEGYREEKKEERDERKKRDKAKAR